MSKGQVSVWQSLERQRGLRSFWINTRDVSGALTPFSFPTVPDQHTTNPQPLYSLSVKLLKSLTLTNVVFMLGTISPRFGKGCFWPHQCLGVWSLCQATDRSQEGWLGDRGDQRKWVNGGSCSAVLPSYCFLLVQCLMQGWEGSEGSNRNTQTQYWRQCFWAHDFMPFNKRSPIWMKY